MCYCDLLGSELGINSFPKGKHAEFEIEYKIKRRLYALGSVQEQNLKKDHHATTARKANYINYDDANKYPLGELKLDTNELAIKKYNSICIKGQHNCALTF
jgi:hypothetical protein